MRECYVENFLVQGQVLRYDPDTGAYQEITDDMVPAGRKIGLGFYAYCEGAVVGVYPTPAGPVCFHNQDRYPLVRGSWDARVTSEDAHDITRGRNRFTLMHHGHTAFTVFYVAPPHRYYDAWSSSDEDVDFFLWLKSNVEGLCSTLCGEHLCVFCLSRLVMQALPHGNEEKPYG